MVPQLHFAEEAFALELLFERFQGLIDVVVANHNLQSLPPFIVALVDATGPLTMFEPAPIWARVAVA